MHTVKLNIHDSIYDHVMFILKNLQPKGLEIKELSNDPQSKTTKAKMKDLFANKDIEIFKTINDPILWQEQQRDEWQW